MATLAIVTLRRGFVCMELLCRREFHYSIYMATSAVPPQEAHADIAPETKLPWKGSAWATCIAALSLAVLLVHGYHPFAEDGGLYLAGVERLLNPSLFPHDTTFVTEHLRFSLFAPMIAVIVRLLHLPLAWVLLLVELLSIGLTLFAAQQLLRRCFPADGTQLGGITLLAAWWTVPVAGTSLLLFDPYVTARSLCTPFALLAIAYALDLAPSTDVRIRRRTAACCTLALLLAALLHPLMAAFAIALVAVVILTANLPRQHAFIWICLTALAVAVCVFLKALAPAESPAVIAAAHSRYYWFLSQWHWYELCGLAGPLVILALLLRAQYSSSVQALCRACIGCGLIAILIALLFAHDGGATHLIARLQPLRVFQMLYAIMTLLLGATLTQHALRSPHPLVRLLPIAGILAAAALMFACQRATFPYSPHIEFPWTNAANPWSRAFLWARDNTPTDALFALDANYISLPSEDAQTFRATSLRSALPDFSKDGGEASITPALAIRWQQGVAAQTALSAEPDSVRERRLLPLGVTWMVLRSAAKTTHPCPYDNDVAKVCRLAP